MLKNIRRLILATIIICPFFSTAATYTPETTEIFWDIHHVIVKKNVSNMMKIAYNTPNKLALLKHAFNWTLLKDVYALLKSGSTGGAFVERLEKEDPRLGRFALHMVNSQDLIDRMEELILDLAKQGYTMYVASNIGTEVYNDLKIKYPHIFNDQAIKDGKTVDFKAEHLVEKPDPQFFIELSRLRDSNKPQAVFIDDKQENIDSANANGFIGVLFDNAKDLATTLNT